MKTKNRNKQSNRKLAKRIITIARETPGNTTRYSLGYRHALIACARLVLTGFWTRQ